MNPTPYTLSARAMNTLFEVTLWGREETYLRSVAEAALDEVRRLEAQLSMYREESDVYELNARAASRPVPVEPHLFYLLARAKGLTAATDGAFDVTMGPLLRAWGFIGGSGRMADPAAVEEARAVSGMHLVEMDEDSRTVRYRREGVTIDLGAIGKGYAIEQAAEIVREMELPGGLIHGGTSTVQGVGTQPGGSPWQVAIQDPSDLNTLLATVPLRDRALSVSAVHGKSFTEGDARYGHVLDPRTGAPARCALLAAVVCDSATDSDALSTALLVLGAPFLDELPHIRPEARGLVVTPSDTGAPAVHSTLDSLPPV